ncbi:MAG: hypothetical protein IT445_11915 [Phycisphaeraceae bacterium]|nr:hypothetical protein [Phycisphaeraceae bacterium]
MEQCGNILIVSKDKAITDVVRSLLEPNTNIQTSTCPTLHEMSAQIRGGSLLGVFVDIDPDPLSILRNLEPIVNQHASLRFIVISSHFSNDLVIEAMGIGVRHFLPRKQLAQELPNVVERLLNQTRTSVNRGGSMVTVLSAGGGCGATTIAVNLARELAGEAQPSLVMDFDAYYGAVATCLGLRGDYSLADLLHYKGNLDAQLVSTTAMEYDKNLHALLHPVSVDAAGSSTLDLTRLETALTACRQTYRWTVADAPRAEAGLMVQLARQSRVVLIVAQMTVKELRRARAMYQRLVDEGINGDGIWYLINRHKSKHGAVSLDEARKALPGGHIHFVRNDFASVMHSMDMGQPLVELAPRSKARRDITALAEAVSNAKPQTAWQAGPVTDAQHPDLSLVG